ncbi:MAG: hypothetical protein NVS2B16_28070 [Chloroflexota bacterium]
MTQQYSWFVALVSTGAAVGLVLCGPATRRRLGWNAVLLLNLSCVLLYFWSWNESHTVTIHVTKQGAVATVDGDTVVMNQPLTGGRIGLQQAPYSSYRITATGEAAQTDRTSSVGRLAAAIRLSAPEPAWSDVSITEPGGRTTALSHLSTQMPTGAWSRNGRGELVAPESAYGLFSPVLRPPYTLTLHSVRPDGSMRVLVNLGPDNSGFALEIRYDQPDLLWSRWSAGTEGPGVGASQLHEMYFVSQVQRAARAALPAYLFAVLFAALAIGAYPIVMTAINGFTAGRDEELDAVRHWFDAPAFQWTFPVAIVVAALGATTSVSAHLLSRIPHVQDSVAYLFQAKIFAAGMLSAPAPPAQLRSFFLEEYMPFHGSAWFSQYPPGHPLMLALGVLVGTPWLVEPVLASAALGLVYVLGRRVYNSGTGALAAVLGLTSPFWLFLGSEFMAHPTGLFFGTACLVCFAFAEERGGRMWPLLAGLAGGMLVLTRQITAVGLLGPLVPYAFFFSRRHWQNYTPALVTFAIPVLFLFVYNWVQMGDPFQSTYGAWNAFYTLGFGPHKAPFGDFTPGDGAWTAYQNLSMLSPQLFGWPYGIALCFMTMPFILGAAQRWDLLLLGCFGGIVVIHAFYWCACLMYGPRFYYEALPPMLLLTARGAYELFRLPMRVWRFAGLPRDETVAALFPGLLIACLVIVNVRFYLPTQFNLYDNYNFSSAAELQAVERAHVHRALIFVVSNPPGFWSSYGNVFFENDPHLKGDVIYAHDLGPKNRLLYRYYPGRRHYRLNGSSLIRIS